MFSRLSLLLEPRTTRLTFVAEQAELRGDEITEIKTEGARGGIKLFLRHPSLSSLSFSLSFVLISCKSKFMGENLGERPRGGALVES